jgi:ParE toxin of type II toxin-antitoxin system, parDE
VKPVKFHPDALAELHRAPQYYYETDLLEVGDALVAELNHALDEIGRQPHLWKRILENIHSYGPTKKFKWRIVYIEQPRDVFVIAAYFSGEEDPLYWIERLAS